MGGQRQAAPRQTAFAIAPSDDRSVAASVASLESRVTEIERRLETIDRLEQILLRLDPQPKGSHDQYEHDGLPAPMDTSSHESDQQNVVGDFPADDAAEAPAH